MMTSDPIGCGATPSAVILSFPAISPRTRAAALFRWALQAVFRTGADNLYAFDAVVGDATEADPARVAEALLAGSFNRALTARERGAIRPLAPAEMASLRAYLDKVAGREDMADSFYQKPILNSPYLAPAQHHALDADGQPLDEPPRAGRRDSTLLVPVPKA